MGSKANGSSNPNGSSRASGDQPLTVVVGLGRSGIGAARWLQAQGTPVQLIESQRNPALEARAQQLATEGISVLLDCPLSLETFAALPQPPGRVVVSPGIPFDHPTLVALRAGGIPVQGEMSVAWEASAGTPWIGITGTNGKTTVTHLVSHLLRHGGLDAPMCGNVGLGAAELALSRQRQGQQAPDWLVVELSSYQIEASAELAPRIGLWTTLTPDHLERHGSLDHYRAIKRGLLERSAIRVLNADDPDLRAHAVGWDRPVRWVSAGQRANLPAGQQAHLWIEAGQVHAAGGPLFEASCLAMPGAHNRQNLLMATAVGLEAGLDPAQMEAAFRAFPGVPHRLERIRERGAISWFNDSKATNYDAAEVALLALEGPLVVLAGGQAKQGDAAGWLRQLQRQAAAVVLFGAAAETFGSMLEQAGYSGSVRLVEGLAEAVSAAAELAPALGCTSVLLSPACASFDQYSDFEARGDHFRQLVQAL
ncbi:MAG: UDP-N-acetylmuramoyl-L-alanine--D-glutamate ligase [Prochlorococcaceae cyanobacterium]